MIKMFEACKKEMEFNYKRYDADLAFNCNVEMAQEWFRDDDLTKEEYKELRQYNRILLTKQSL